MNEFYADPEYYQPDRARARNGLLFNRWLPATFADWGLADHETLTYAEALYQLSSTYASGLHEQDLLASICFNWGKASRILFLYTAGPFNWRGFPSKYTVVSSFLSFSSLSNSAKSLIWQFDAQSSSKWLR
jgi:hypothetical protein